MSNPVIEAKDLSKVYKTAGEELHALKNVSLKVNPGESLAIVGKSGSGKSTLMHVLATLDRPTSGSLKINGNEVTSLKTAQLERLRNKSFGFVFQQFFINARSSCLENVILPLMIMGISPAERKKRGLEMLDKVGLGDKAGQKANDLSGGQKQRTAAARAIITKPSLLLADEPTGALDSKSATDLLESLKELSEVDQATILMVTHDAFAASYCDRVVFIKDGKLFTELVKGKSTRKEFFQKVLDVLSALGGGLSDSI